MKRMNAAALAATMLVSCLVPLAPAEAMLRVKDSPTAEERTEQNKRFVEHLYHELLGREPDAGGLDYFWGRLQNGEHPDRIRADIAKSPEARTYAEGFVAGLYREFLGFEPDAGGLSYWVGAIVDQGVPKQRIRQAIAQHAKTGKIGTRSLGVRVESQVSSTGRYEEKRTRSVEKFEDTYREIREGSAPLITYTPEYQKTGDPLKAAGVPLPGESQAGNQKTVTTLSSEEGQKDGIPGTWVTAARETKERVYREVYAIYMRHRGHWNDGLNNHYMRDDESQKKDHIWNAAKNASYGGVAGDGFSYNALRKFYEDNQAWLGDGESYGGIILIDPSKNEIVGAVQVPAEATGADNSHRIVDDNYLKTYLGQSHSARKLGGGSIDIKINDFFFVSPILLDLAGLGRPDLLAGSQWKLAAGRNIASNALRPFDLDGTGRHHWEWVGPKSGLLVWDPERKGQITSGKQLFGNITWGKKWKDGYAPLATLDANKDGKLTGAELSKLGVWVDANSNSVSEPGEVKPLASHGIVSLSVKAERDKAGNAMAKAGFTRALPGGKTQSLATWDWISYGVAKATQGTYVWVGEAEGRPVGGFLNLEAGKGAIKGVSFATFGNKEIPNGLVAAQPLHGSFKGGVATWTNVMPDGSKAVNTFKTTDGDRLEGTTTLTKKGAMLTYHWKAEFLEGAPLGLGR